MKKLLLFTVMFAMFGAAAVPRAQNCINFITGQEGIGTVSATFGVSLADFNGDGWLDVVTIDAYEDIEVYFNDGEGLLDTNAYTLGADRWRFGVQVIDIDNDGDWDFVTAPMSSNSYGIEVWENNGQGQFTLKSDNTANHSSGHELAAGDLNGDGYVDIFFPNSDKVGIYLNDGNGNFIDNGQELEASSPESAVLFDADNDGDLDAAVATGFTAKFYTNDGNGFFTQAQNNMADDTEGVAAADFNGDGYKDLVFAPWHGYLEIWINDGLGTFLPADTLFNAGQEFFIDVEAFDLNYDNLPDIITDQFVLQNNPAQPGTFLPPTYFNTGSSHDFETGDINNDNLTDIYIGRFSSSNGDIVNLYDPGTMLYADTTLCYGDSLFAGGNWYSQPGNIMLSAGCDSILTLNLSFYDQIDTSVVLNGTTLTAVATGLEYQWINCADSSIIEGATAQSFTPEQTGEYAVIITDGPCSAMSQCFLVVITNAGELPKSNISLYPNPSDGIFTVDLGFRAAGCNITVSDITGEKVQNIKATGRKTDIDISGVEPGVYIITIKTQDSITVKRIVKQ